MAYAMLLRTCAGRVRTAAVTARPRIASSRFEPVSRHWSLSAAAGRTRHYSNDPYGFAGFDERGKDEGDETIQDYSKKGRRLRKNELKAARLEKELFHREVRALIARLGETVEHNVLVQAMTYATSDLYPKNNAMSRKGFAFARKVAMETVAGMYPKLPKASVEGICGHLLGTERLNIAGRAFGIDAIVRFEEDADQSKAVADAFLSIVTAIRQGAEHGDEAARRFVVETIVAQLKTLDVSECLVFEQPRQTLAHVLGGKPSYSLIGEAGRLTHKPTFVMGVFHNDKLIGQGAGWSLKLAKEEATKSALASLLAQRSTEGAASVGK